MKFLVLTFLFLSACATTRSIKTPETITSPGCLEEFRKANGQPGHEQLNLVSDLYTKNCYFEVISLGEQLRGFQRDKFYNVSAEVAEIFVPEGTVTEYVMESFERGYLAILMSLSYLRIDKPDDALVELRKAAQEQNAGLYNFGEDPILAMLMAAIWDRFDTSMSRPFWKYLSETSPSASASDAIPVISQFAERRIKEIDAYPGQKISWNIRGFGNLPQLQWQSDFISQSNGPYKIYPGEPFPQSCQGVGSLFVATEPWVEKIAIRYKSEYHPFLFAKSLVRVPVGLGYGILGTTAGVAVGVGGCGLAAYGSSRGSGGEGAGKFCEASIDAAGSIIGASANLVEYTLKPDLRHWQNLPKAISLTRHDTIEQAPTSCDLKRSAMLETVQLTP